MAQVSPILYPLSSTPPPSSFQSLILLNSPPSTLPHFCVLCPPSPHFHHPTPLTFFTHPHTLFPPSCTSFPQSPSTIIIPFPCPPLPTLTSAPPFPTPLPLSTPLPYSLLAHSSTLLPLICVLSSSIPPYSSPHCFLSFPKT